MKVKQEIIEATYSIEELTKEQYELLQDGLREIISNCYRVCPELDRRGAKANTLLEELKGN